MKSKRKRNARRCAKYAMTVIAAILVMIPTIIYADTDNKEYVVLFDAPIQEEEAEEKTLDADLESLEELETGETLAVVTGDVDKEEIEEQENVRLVCERVEYKLDGWEESMERAGDLWDQPDRKYQDYLASIGWASVINSGTSLKTNAAGRPKIAVLDTGISDEACQHWPVYAVHLLIQCKKPRRDVME